MKKPVIGITLDLAQNSEQYKYATFPWYAVRKNYVDAVVKAEGMPIMLPYHDDLDNIINIIDALIIIGGTEDIHPKFYNQEIMYDKIKTNDQRAMFEIELTKKVIAKNIPFLGICNGMQLLNIIRGGDLIQHIPDYFLDLAQNQLTINHEQPAPKHIPSHLININPGTLLNKFANNKSEIMVNSTHHQAVLNLGDGLIISATAPDGIIEAIELPSHKYVIGVEWHPEYLNSDLDLNLFKGLVKAAKV
jgi:putative glutamine amidotransferase